MLDACVYMLSDSKHGTVWFVSVCVRIHIECSYRYTHVLPPLSLSPCHWLNVRSHLPSSYK